MRRWIAIGLCLCLVLLWPAAGAADGSAAVLLDAAQAARERGDEASAFALLRRLAVAEDAEGQHRLGLLLEQPAALVQPDPEGAAYWHGRAAEQGHAGAAKRLGDLYASGAVGAFQAGGQQAPLIGEAIGWYQRAAALGNAEAESALQGLAARSPLAAALLARAAGDHAAARAGLEALADRFDPEALYWRGAMQEAGEGGAPDLGGAVPWYQRSYQLGFGPAALRLGQLHESGQGVPRDIDQAQRMYSAAGVRRASSGEAQAAVERLSFERQLGSPPPATVDGALRALTAQMPTLAAAILYPLAEAGSADAQHWLAATLAGDHHDEAIRWYRAAALQGDSEAAYELARLFDNRTDRAGRPLGDAAERARWLRRAAEAGHIQAARELGFAYREGRGVAADQAEAERWQKRALHAEAGWSKLSRPACVEDASEPLLLPAFLACNRDDDAGLAGALIPLAQAGHARAQAWLAFLLAGGPGTGGGYDLRVRASPQRAARWYAAAAKEGLASAMHDYGVILEHGMGVPVDVAAARSWYARAAEKGSAEARKALEALGPE